jgi:hypothetical protein
VVRAHPAQDQALIELQKIKRGEQSPQPNNHT